MEEIVKRYQVFVSSTFLDLKDERAAAINMIQNLNHIPAGMELFPASPQTPWDLIKRVINLSDYYIVIVGGRYGSTDDDGLSFTEKEYDYALDQKKPVIALLYHDINELPLKSVDIEKALRQKLELFIEKLKKGHTVKTWESAIDLAAKVSVSLMNAISSMPAVGWVRADGIDSTELLRKNSELHEDNARLRREVDALRTAQSRNSSSDRTIAVVADNLGGEGANWFLGLSEDLNRPTYISSLQQKQKDLANQLLRANLLTLGGDASPLRLSQSGWELRDELLRRKMLEGMLDAGPMELEFVISMCGSTEEGRKIFRELSALNYIRQEDAIADEPPSFVLTDAGIVAAQRLYSE